MAWSCNCSAASSWPLLGPNGSGKSTLLRLLAGLTRPEGGSIHIGGWQVPAELAALRAQIGYVGHETLLYDHLSARENLRFLARLYSLDEPDRRIRELLAQVGLERRAQELVRNYSRGMQQRLAIARALLPQPAVLLLDEPFDGLDAAATEMLAQLLCVTQERSILMATHRFGLAERLAGRALILQHGVVGAEVSLADSVSGTLARALRRIDGVRAMSTGFLSAALTIAGKDLRAELRSRELLGLMGLFALLAILVFSFAFELERMGRQGAVSGVLWVTLIFASILGHNRGMALEREHGGFDALLLAPVPRGSIFCGKMLANALLTLLVGALLLPLLTVLFNLPTLPASLLLILPPGCLGLAAVGTLLATMTVQTRAARFAAAHRAAAGRAAGADCRPARQQRRARQRPAGRPLRLAATAAAHRLHLSRSRPAALRVRAGGLRP